jgi:rod shape-determining protein MreB
VLIKSCIQQALGNRPFLKPRVVVAAPHRRHRRSSAARSSSPCAAGAREVTIVSKPMAAALGADLPVSESLATWWSTSAAGRRGSAC